MSASRGSYTPKAAPTSRFDVFATALREHLHATFDTSAKTTGGVINTAFKQLKSSFMRSIKGVAAAVENHRESTASRHAASPSRHVTPSRPLGAAPSRPQPSPVTFPSLDNYVTQSQVAFDTESSEDENAITQPHRLNQQYIVNTTIHLSTTVETIQQLTTGERSYKWLLH